MKLRRSANKMLIEPPSVATGDIAFNLLVFFLVCASTQPDSGRRQDMPRSDPEQQQQEQSQNIEVSLKRTEASINGKVKSPTEFVNDIRLLLNAKTKPEDKVVVVKSDKDVPYDRWIQYTGWIAEAGGTPTVLREEEQTVVAN
jgi:biopolymer transport protein ExbD